jgi:hypothetical protein
MCECPCGCAHSAWMPLLPGASSFISKLNMCVSASMSPKWRARFAVWLTVVSMANYQLDIRGVFVNVIVRILVRIRPARPPRPALAATRQVLLKIVILHVILVAPLHPNAVRMTIVIEESNDGSAMSYEPLSLCQVDGLDRLVFVCAPCECRPASPAIPRRYAAMGHHASTQVPIAPLAAINTVPGLPVFGADGKPI